MKECNKPYSITHVSELDVDDLSTTVDYFLGVRAVEDTATGDTIYSPVRVPGEKVVPAGNLANVAAITTNNSSLSLEFGDIYGGYIDTQPTGDVMRYANATHPADFLMIGDYTNGKMLTQATGYLSIPAGHRFIIGTQYYLGEDGAPVTDSSITGQKLFKPISETILNVNGDF